MSKSDNGSHSNRITPGHLTGRSAGIFCSGRKISGVSQDVDLSAVVLPWLWVCSYFISALS